MYFAFWSATDKSFHPVRLFAVHPGDQILAELVHAGGRWAVTIRDRTSGAHAGLVTGDEARSSFTEAKWVQEDITNAQTSTPFPYPDRMSTVRFAHIAVDSRPPAQNGVQSMWMSENRRNLAPSPLSHDSFSLRDAQLAPAGLTYLQIAAPEDAATQAFTLQMAHWTTHTARPVIMAQSARFATALRGNMRALGHARWPGQDEPLVRELHGDMQRLLAQATSVAHIPAARLKAWEATFARDTIPMGTTATQLRQALGIPQITPTR